MSISADVKRAHVGRLKAGGDLAEEVGRFLDRHGVRFGVVSIIGALAKAKLGSYHFGERVYKTFDIDHESEILHCTGNISTLDGKTFAHLHATLSGEDGRAFGGHVFPGCAIHVAECVVLEFAGEPPVRQDDPQTGLKLWPAES
ncbi:MAG: DNA-binding protein [Myxococcales bacterium]|nr:MAG: DNA-binding protein [Myxococcales bacterium]